MFAEFGDLLPNFAKFQISLKFPKPKKLVITSIQFIFSIHSIEEPVLQLDIPVHHTLGLQVLQGR